MRKAVLILVLIAIIATFAIARAALIIEDMAISGIMLGKSTGTVATAVFGNPLTIRHGMSEDPRVYYEFQNSISVVTISDAGGQDRVVQVIVREPGHRTDRGVGVGDTLDKVIGIYGEPSRQKGVFYIYKLAPDRLERLVFVACEGRVQRFYMTMEATGP